MSEITKDQLGPLAPLAGIWEGEKGDDIAPSSDRKTGKTKFREKMVFTPFGPVNNHEQILYGLKYSTTAWRIGEEEPFHEELGYWLWDAREKQVMRCFMVPRGVTIIAGGTVDPSDKSIQITSTVGSDTYGICSNKFLDREFKTVRYELDLTINDVDSFSYKEDTQIKIKGQDNIFHHTDANSLQRIS